MTEKLRTPIEGFPLILDFKQFEVDSPNVKTNYLYHLGDPNMHGFKALRYKHVTHDAFSTGSPINNKMQNQHTHKSHMSQQDLTGCLHAIAFILLRHMCFM